ncbi:SH3 domain-containing protein, partial [Clostridium perfringens]
MKQMRKVKMLLLSILMSCTFIITPMAATQVSNTNYVAVCEAASISGTLKGTIKRKTYMRKTQSTSAKSLCKLTGRKKVKVLSVNKKWAKVKYDNKTGYVLWSNIK